MKVLKIKNKSGRYREIKCQACGVNDLDINSIKRILEVDLQQDCVIVDNNDVDSMEEV